MSQTKNNASNNKSQIHFDNDRMTGLNRTTSKPLAIPPPGNLPKRETIFNNNRITGFNRVRIKTLAHTSLRIFNHPPDTFDVAYLRRILVMYGMLREERTPGLSDHDVCRCASYFSSQLGPKKNRAIATLLESRPLVEAVTLQAICDLELAQASKKKRAVRSTVRDDPVGDGSDAVINNVGAGLAERIGEGGSLKNDRSSAVAREDDAGDGIEESLNTNTCVMATASVDKSEPSNTEIEEYALDLSDPENYALSLSNSEDYPPSHSENHALPDPDNYALSDPEDYALSDIEKEPDEDNVITTDDPPKNEVLAGTKQENEDKQDAENGLEAATKVEDEAKSESDDEIEDYQTKNDRGTKSSTFADNGLAFVTHRNINRDVRDIKKDLSEIRGMMKKANANLERIESFL